MATTIAIILVALGALVLLFGKRIFVLAAGIGALLGVGILRILPGVEPGVFALLVVFGMAIVGGLIGFFVKGLSHLLMAIIGFLAGSAITLAILDSLGLGLGFFAFILALAGGVIGWLLVKRFFDWAIVTLAALIGALLVTRGLQLTSLPLTGVVGTLLWVVLAVLDFLYLSQDLRRKK